MILNLSKKTIISSNPLYKKSRVLGLDFLARYCLVKNDSVVFQNCRILCNFFLIGEADILFINSDNRICRIDVLRKKFFLKVAAGRVIVLLPRGNAAITDTETGDILDLNAELTIAQKKKFLKVPRLIVPVPGTVISRSQNIKY